MKRERERRDGRFIRVHQTLPNGINCDWFQANNGADDDVMRWK